MKISGLRPAVIWRVKVFVKQDNPNEKIDTIFFEFTGYDAHPRVKQHQANAAKLTAFIKQKMSW